MSDRDEHGELSFVNLGLGLAFGSMAVSFDPGYSTLTAAGGLFVAGVGVVGMYLSRPGVVGGTSGGDRPDE